MTTRPAASLLLAFVIPSFNMIAMLPTAFLPRIARLTTRDSALED